MSAHRLIVFCFLLTAFCILPSFFFCLLPSAYCLLFSDGQSLLQDLFLRSFDRHTVAVAMLIHGPVLEHVIPLFTQSFDFPLRIPGLLQTFTGRGTSFFTLFLLRGGFQCFRKGRRSLQTRLWRQALLVAQCHG